MTGVVSGKRQVESRFWILVVLPVLAIPFENEYTFLGYSLAKLTIIPLFLAVVLFQPQQLSSMITQPVFMTGMAFVVWGAIVEAFHPFSNWQFHYSMFQMFFFAALIAVVTSNAIVFRRVLLALSFICSLLALYLVYNFYGSVNVDVSGWREASRIRGQAFAEIPLETNLNVLGYTVGMGSIIALAKLLVSNRMALRTLWGSLYVLCAVGSLMPLSRGAFIAVVGASIAVLCRDLRKSIKPERVLFVLAIMALVFMLLPGALTGRLSSLTPGGADESGKVEGRTQIFMTAVDSIAEYWVLGVGAGQFWQEWGWVHGFGTLGPHNGFLASWIYFGLPGLVLLCLICWVAAAVCLRQSDTSWEATALLGLLVLALVWLTLTHNLYFKAFSVILGLIMAASRRVSSARLVRNPLEIYGYDRRVQRVRSAIRRARP